MQHNQVKCRKYFCVHCHSSNNLNCYIFETIENVYGHWLSNHTELPVALPFQFYAVEMIACYYCNFMCYYNQLGKHHQNHHSNVPFVRVRTENRQECAQCLYSGDDIVCHYQQMHASNDCANIFNPICFTKELLSEIFTIDIHKKRRCNYCNDTFETDHEIKMHSFLKHPDLDVSIVQWNDVQPNEISYLICGLCNREIQPAHFLNHIETESERLGASSERFISYMKTKVIFGNGFVAHKQNLICSPYDDSEQIQGIIQHFAAQANGFRYLE